jgi:hypothetical protein
MADIEVKKINQLPLASGLNLANDILALEQSGIAKKIPIATLRQNDASGLTQGTLPDARLSSNIPKLNQANTFAPGVVQTTGQQTIDIGVNFNNGNKGVKVDGMNIGLQGDGLPALWILAEVYSDTFLEKMGFVGEIIVSRGGTISGVNQGITTKRAMVSVTTARNFRTLAILSDDAGINIHTVEYGGKQCYAVKFDANPNSRITASGLLFQRSTPAPILPIFIPDATAYTTTPVPTASLQALRAKFANNGNFDVTIENSTTVAHTIGGAGTVSHNASNQTIGATAWRYQGIGTGTGTDLIMDASGYILKKTSSAKLKRDVEDILQDYADTFIDKARPVFYRLIENSPSYPDDWSYWGLIAEELAEIDPRLVNWGYWPEDYEEVEYEVVGDAEEGQEPAVTTEKVRQLKADAVMSPIGVQYDRIAVLMLKVMQADRERLNSIESRLDALEAAK